MTTFVMATSTKLFLLCAILNLRLSKQSPSGAHHREHKVHNIVLYPDRHSWCKTTTIKQVINYPGCVSAEINNNVCVGACFSYSIPRTEPSDPGEVIVPYCDSCQPSATTWHQITLQCDANKSDASPLLVKHVQIIHNCSCTLCDERYKIGNKVTYDIIKNNNMDAEPDDVASNIKVASDLMVLQNLHAAQAYSTDIDDNTNSSNSLELAAFSDASSESASEIMRFKRMQRMLNQKIIALLANIQQHNRLADKEQLLDLLHVAEHDIGDSTNVDSSKSFKLQLDEIKQSLEGEENLSPSTEQRIRDLLKEIYSFKLQRAASDCVGHDADMLTIDTSNNDDDSSYNDDNVQQFVGNDLDSIAQQTSQDLGWQEDHDNKNEDANTNEASTAADYMLPIWLHDVNTAGDSNKSSNSKQQHVIEITNIVEQRKHEQQQLQHQSEHQQHHQLAQHHKQREDDEAIAAHKRHQHQQNHPHHHHYHHHHHHYSKLQQQQQDEELSTAVPSQLVASEFLTNDALLLHRPHHQQNVQPREQLDVNAHELKPNHAGTLLSYHSHVAQRDEATVVADDDD